MWLQAKLDKNLRASICSFRKNKLTLAATDSFRLAEYIIDLKKEDFGESYEKFIERNNAVIVPAQNSSRNCKKHPRIQRGERSKYIWAKARFFSKRMHSLYVSRLIDGKYPEYKQVIPKEFFTNFCLGREDFLKAVKAASVFSDSKSREIRLKIKSGEKKIQVGAQSVETGENISDVTVRCKS